MRARAIAFGILLASSATLLVMGGCFDFDVTLRDPSASAGDGSDDGSGNGDGSNPEDLDGSGSKDGGPDARYCPPRSAEGFDVDLTMAAVKGSITVAGAAPLSSSLGYGQISLRAGLPDSLLLANSYEENYAPKYVLAGTYEAFFGEPTVGTGTGAPHNRLVRIATGIKISAGTNDVDVDVPMASITGGSSIGGSSSGRSPLGYGNLFLSTPAVPPRAGDRIDLGQSYSTTFQVIRAVPGTYDLMYEVAITGNLTTVPQNRLAKLKSVTIKAGANTINVDVPATTIIGTIKIGGANPLGTLAGYGQLYLRAQGGDQIALGATSSGSFPQMRVVPGTYDLDYELTTDGNGTGAPSNTRYRVKSGIVVNAGPNTINIDVPMTTVTGTITLDGNPPPPSSSGYGSITGRMVTSTQDWVDFGQSYQPTYTTRVAPGTYDLYYTTTSPGTAALLNGKPTRFRTGVVIGAGGGTVNIDVPSATISGGFTVNGAPPQPATEGDGRILLIDALGGEVVIGSSHETTFKDRRLVPGTYDAYYAVTTVGPGAPVNKLMLIKSGIVIKAGANTLKLDIPITTMSGKFSINNLPPQPAANGYGELRLKGAAPTDEIRLGATADQKYGPILIIPGTYDLIYDHVDAGTGTGAPLNKDINLGCFEIK